jgi:hypothetical protein
MKETKDLFNENYKPLKREFEEDIRDGNLHARVLVESVF